MRRSRCGYHEDVKRTILMKRSRCGYREEAASVRRGSSSARQCGTARRMTQAGKMARAMTATVRLPKNSAPMTAERMSCSAARHADASVVAAAAEVDRRSMTAVAASTPSGDTNWRRRNCRPPSSLRRRRRQHG